MTSPSEEPTTPHDVDDLRAEVARLRAEADARGAEEDARRTGWWRPVVVTVLIVIAALLAPLAVVARWAHDEVSDTDRYVSSVAPLASDPAVQAAVTDRITAEIISRLQVQAVTQQAVDALSQRGLPPVAATSLAALSGPLANAIEGFIHDQVANLVASSEFQTAWEAANREAHAQLVAVITGKGSDVVKITDNAVSVNLATVIDAVKQRLVARGFTLADRLPEVQAQFTIFQSNDIGKAQRAFRLLSALATLLPILALVLIAAAVAIARRRRRTLIAAMLAVAASMLVLGLALNASRMIYLDAIPSDQIPPDAAAAIYDTLVWFIRLNLRAILVLALTVAFIAWVSGPGGAAVALRRGTTRTIGGVRRGGERVGLDTGRFGDALGTYRGPIRGVVLGLALLVYVMAAHPTGRFTLILVLVTGVVLLLVELLAKPPAQPDEVPPAARPPTS